MGRRERPLGRDPQPVQRRPARGRGAARHHLRRSGRPSPDDPAGRARALQYDLALNGWELGGGSIRIHRRDLLERSFLLQGHSLEAMREKFGAVLDAFEYGAPPHGGIALGIDRWAALLADQTNIREVMAFPKTQSGSDLMLEAPSIPEPGQYEELGLRFVGPGGRRGATVSVRRPGGELSAERLGPLDWFARRPRLAALLGATCIAFSGIFYRYAEVSPSTGTVFRALFGLPLLVLVAFAERRRYGPLPRRPSGWRRSAGVFFAGDLLLWHHAIEAVGAGLATVLGQPAGHRRRLRGLAPARGAAVPGDPARAAGGAGRRRSSSPASSGRSVRRDPAARRHPRDRDGALLCRLPAGDPARRPRPPPAGGTGGGRDRRRRARCVRRRRGGRRPRPDSRRPPAWSGWPCSGSPRSRPATSVISISLPRLPAVVTSIILLAQPVMTVVLSIVLLGEAPSATQLVGVALVIGGIAAATVPIARFATIGCARAVAVA